MQETQEKEACLIPGSVSEPWRRKQQHTPIFMSENPMDRASHTTVHGVVKDCIHTHNTKLPYSYLHFQIIPMSQYFYKHAWTLYITLLSHIFCRKHLQFCPMLFYFDYNIFPFMDRCVSAVHALISIIYFCNFFMTSKFKKLFPLYLTLFFLKKKVIKINMTHPFHF